jgi:hypothetical protein
MLVGEFEEMRHSWEGNIKMYLKGIVFVSVGHDRIQWRKTFGFRKRRGIFDQLSDDQLLKEDFAPRIS